MKRPLFTACLVVVFLAAAGLFLRPPISFSYGDAVGEEVRLTGRIYAKEIKMGYASPILTLYIEPIELTCNQQNISYEDNFICTLQSGETEPSIGSIITVEGVLQEYEPARNPGQFDAKAYYQILHISARIQKAEVVEAYGGDTFLEGLWRIKKFLSGMLEEIFSKEDAAVLKTMLLGDKSLLDEEIKTSYKEAGILHVLAISGLHITLLGMGLFKGLRKLYLPVVPASFLCGVCMLLYGFMVGMPVSAIRAITMFLLRLLAGSIGRTYDMLTALMLCCACMLLEQPLYLNHAGFLLSFSAVLAVGILKPAITPELKKNVIGALVDSFFTTLSITIFTLPIQLYFYYEVSVYSVFFNLLVLPLVGWVIGLGIGAMGVFSVSRLLAGVVGGQVQTLGSVSALAAQNFVYVPGALLQVLASVPTLSEHTFTHVLMGWLRILTYILALPVHAILTLYLQGCVFIRTLPGSIWMPGQPDVWQIGCFCILLGLVIALKMLHLKYKLGLLCGAVLLFGIRDTRGLTVTFLDVGQGDCICIELPGGGAWLVDGGSSDVSGVGEYRIEPFLKSQGIATLEAVFLSHSDSDHTSGVVELLESGRIEIEMLALPCAEQDSTEEGFGEILALAKQRDIPVLWLQAGMTWEHGGVEAVCFHPEDGSRYATTNAASEVLYITYGNFSMLLTGDVEGAGEEALLDNLQEADISDVTVLKVAHHGSKYSSDAALLEQLSPRLAVISCGEDNSYGHPHEETLDRLGEVGSVILTTPEHEAITVEVGRKVEVRSWMQY